jgi:hypothetical protein
VAFPEHVSDEEDLVSGGLAVGLSEDGSHGGGDHLGVAFGHTGQQVPHEMDPATLPGRP